MKIAILIPCYNEELTIDKVIKDFKSELPEAQIYVYDNNSKDKTSQIAEQNGIIVRKEFRQGKGNVVRSMFRDIDADCYVLVDGDDTYPANFVHQLIKPILSHEANMVIGERLSNGTYKNENKRAFHNFGNQFVKKLINKLFNSNINDIMTGYRAFDKEFVKSIPILKGGFEIETEMTIHSLDKNFLIKEMPIEYRDRPEGSFSKLNTFSDGLKVLKTILMLYKNYKPLAFFSLIGTVFLAFSILTGLPVVIEFILTRYVSKVPSAILATGLMLLATFSFVSGLILDTIVKQHRQMFELFLNDLRIKNSKESI